MQSVMIVLLGIAGMLFGWFVYSKFIASRIFGMDDRHITPAHALRDDRDFVPTNRLVLWGHHFTSVAGAAPIVGPAIAVYWGWVPAVLWVVFGTIFFAGVHDMGALWASSRHKGKSMGALSEAIVGRRTRTLFMIVVFLVLLMVNAVFGVVIAKAFISQPTAVLPAWAAIAFALVIGQLLRRGLSLTLLCAIGIGALYGTVWAGTAIPLALPEQMFGLPASANWILILFAYAAVASLLPVWVLLQPRDFINGVQLIVGLVLLYGAVFLFGPDITAPAFNDQVQLDTPSLIPLLFVTIACGAVSGFHGIVSSGTSSKQLDRETDARFVGYLGAVGEGALALIAIVAVSGVTLAVSPAEWHQIYSHLGAGSVTAFITGGSNLIQAGWGIPADLSATLLAVMVVLFAGTTMDSGVRLQRYILQEWGEIYGIDWLRKGAIATLAAVACCLGLAFGAGGLSGDGGMVIWPLFGSTNQILAGLTLLVISIYLIRLGKPARYTLAPMIFVLLMAFFAAVLQLQEYIAAGNWLLAALDLAVLTVCLFVLLEGWSAVHAHRRLVGVPQTSAQ